MKQDYQIFDAHCDTISKLYEQGGSLEENKCHIDLSRMRKYQSFCQVFAMWIDDLYAQNMPFQHTMRLIDHYYQMICQSNNIMHVNSMKEVREAFEQNKLASFLSIEGGEALAGEIANLRIFHKLGVRLMTLTWNRRNEIGDGVGESSKGGLSNFGKEVIAEMNRLHMIIDVSHITKQGFWDTISLTSAPIVASHSNSEAVAQHKRNLDDEQFCALVKNGGVAGINFYSEFLNTSGRAAVIDIYRHIEHFLSLGGENNIGLGADFDGVDTLPANVNGVQDLELIIEELLKHNMSEELVHKILYGNFARLFQEVLK